MKPTIKKQRQDVATIFAVCRDLGVPLQEATVIAAGYFAHHDLSPPVSIVKFLAGKETPAPGSFPSFVN